MTTEKENYCDWKYILVAIILLIYTSFDNWLTYYLSGAIYNFNSVIEDLIMVAIFIWIIVQGYRHSKIGEKE